MGGAFAPPEVCAALCCGFEKRPPIKSGAVGAECWGDKMGPMIFAFAVIFGVLSGWTGAVVAARLRGWAAVLLGLVVSAAVMAVFVAIQLGLLNFLGGEMVWTS